MKPIFQKHLLFRDMWSWNHQNLVVFLLFVGPVNVFLFLIYFFRLLILFTTWNIISFFPEYPCKWGHQGNFKLLYFFTKRFYTHKKHKTHKTHINEQKQKMQRFYTLKKHLRGRKSLIRLFAFCAFAWLCLCAFCACKIFS